MAKYIYEYRNWTKFTWQDKALQLVFGDVRHRQGQLMGQMNALGFTAKAEATLTALTMDIVKSSEIEGEMLQYEQVRSSVARRLGINTGGLVNRACWLLRKQLICGPFERFFQSQTAWFLCIFIQKHCTFENEFFAMPLRATPVCTGSSPKGCPARAGLSLRRFLASGPH